MPVLFLPVTTPLSRLISILTSDILDWFVHFSILYKWNTWYVLLCLAYCLSTLLRLIQVVVCITVLHFHCSVICIYHNLLFHSNVDGFLELLYYEIMLLWRFLTLSSVQFSRSVMSNSLWPRESQHARPPCPRYGKTHRNVGK